MKTIKYLCKRNVKIYFKDKGMLFPSLITPVILLVLYATFLKKVYDDSFRSSLKAAGVTISDSVINGCVGGQLVSSLLAVCCVTVAFCSNLLMIKDKTSGAIKDLTVSPVKPSVLSISYFLSSLLSTLIISAVGTAACLIYLAATGWYLSFADVISLLLNVILLTTFGTALSSCVNFFLSTDGQASAVGTIVSAGYGFICGAYMPLSAFGEGLRNALGFLPGTYGTSLIRNCTLRGVFAEMSASGFPAEVVESIRDSIDCNLYFFGNKVEVWAMYLIMLGSTALLIGLYVLMNVLATRRKNK